MKLASVDRRGKVMLLAGWICSSIFSMPQAFIFHVETHPNITHYEQCVTYHFFNDTFHEKIYSMMSMILMYDLPLVIIIFCYASIYIELYKKSRKCVTGVYSIHSDLTGWIIRWLLNFNFIRSLPSVERWRIEPSETQNPTNDHYHCNRIHCVLDSVLCDVSLVSGIHSHAS